MSVDFKQCPCCGENIREAAIKCRYCKEYLIQCYYCAEWIPHNASVCPYCEEPVGAKHSFQRFRPFWGRPAARGGEGPGTIQAVRSLESALSVTSEGEPKIVAGAGATLHHETTSTFRGSRLLVCPKCGMLNPFTADACVRCGKIM